MFDFIPVKLYYDVYINVSLGIVVFTLLHTYALKLNDSKNINFINVIGHIVFLSLIVFLGMRPIHRVFGDTVNYNVAFINYSNGGSIRETEDYFWHVFMKFMSQVVSVKVFFTVCVFIYIYPMYLLSKKLFKEYWYYSFMMFVISFSFYTYGVNGVRNGVALSLFLWGLCYKKNKSIMFLFFFIGIMFHKTALLPVIAYLITGYFNNPKIFLKSWVLCIPLSLLAGSLFITLFAAIGFGDNRLAGYLTSQAEEGTFSSTGFRWDFLFYSAFAVFAGWYFIFKKQFKDKYYFRLFNTYLICNGFWVLVIKANYSNRFAYLSWFMMAIIIIYPMLKKVLFKSHHIMIGGIFLAYFSFTYFMYLVFYKIL